MLASSTGAEELRGELTGLPDTPCMTGLNFLFPRLSQATIHTSSPRIVFSTSLGDPDAALSASPPCLVVGPLLEHPIGGNLHERTVLFSLKQRVQVRDPHDSASHTEQIVTLWQEQGLSGSTFGCDLLLLATAAGAASTTPIQVVQELPSVQLAVVVDSMHRHCSGLQSF